jgi:hypothetical protein
LPEHGYPNRFVKHLRQIADAFSEDIAGVCVDPVWYGCFCGGCLG